MKKEKNAETAPNVISRHFKQYRTHKLNAAQSLDAGAGNSCIYCTYIHFILMDPMITFIGKEKLCLNRDYNKSIPQSVNK